MKRVMSILLVAMLLVSALPLAASAKSLMDNLNALPGQETKPTQPAPVVPVVPEAPAAPVATEAPAAPAAPAAFSLFSARATNDDEDEPVYFKFVLAGTGEAVGEGKVFSHNGSIDVSDAISQYLDNTGKYSFARVKWSTDSVSERADYEMQPENCSEDAPFRIVVTLNPAVTLDVYLDGSAWKTGNKFYDSEMTARAMLNQVVPNWSNIYEQDFAPDNTNINLDGKYKAGTTVSV